MITRVWLQAGHLRAQNHARSKERVGQRDDAVPVVHGVRESQRISSGGGIVGAHGAEVFADGLPGIVVRKRRAARQPAREQFGAVRVRPEGHVRQHGAVQVRHLHVLTGSVGQEALARLRVGHHAHVTHREALAEAFVIAEQEQAILLHRTAQRAAELIAAEWRNAALVEIIRRIERAVAQKLEQRSVQRVAADCVTTNTCAPARLPYDAP